MQTPGFYITGAPHPAATALCTQLEARPDIDFRGSTPCQTGDPAQGPAPRLRGHYAPYSLSCGAALSTILNDDPEARFVICIDNPVNIAWHLHRENLASGLETIADFSTAWSLSAARRAGRGVAPGQDGKLLDYTSLAALGQHLVRLRCRVSETSLHFIFAEDLVNEPAKTWASLEAFLGLDCRPCTLAFTQRQTLTLRARRLLARCRAQTLPLLSGADMIPGPKPDSAAKSTVSARLSEDIATLSVLTGRDLSHWLS